jgi:hypothetical protein
MIQKTQERNVKIEKEGRIYALVFVWGGSLGFVVGAGLAALLYRWLGVWPESEKLLSRP